MNKEDMLIRAKNARYCLYNAQWYLDSARRELTESITVNSKCFNGDKVEHINNGINDQMRIINNELIPAISAVEE